jgi:predicted DCC family thiol-disulfide oxidoreductase YuxK
MQIMEHRSHSYRDDPDIPNFPDDGPVTVMDAHCALCARGAAWIARHDAAQQFRIIPLQSARGTALMRHYGMDPDDPTSWLLLHEGIAHRSMDAVIKAGALLGGVSRGLAILKVLPPRLRHWIYIKIARNRYRLFGRGDLCNLPDPAVQARLLL